MGSFRSTIELHPHVECAAILHDKMFSVITVHINGASRTFERPLNVAELVTQLELTGKRVAIERNGEIVPRGLFAQQQIADGDKIELVVAVGGG